MPTVAERMNDRLRTVFRTDDPVYRALVANDTPTPTLPISKPNDFDQGALSNLLAWNKELVACLKDQLFLNKATGDFLKFIVQDMLGEFRYEGETDAQMVARIQLYVMAPKLSNASIINATTGFSSPSLPEIIRCVRDQMYCDVSYCDSYGSQFTVDAGAFVGEIIDPAFTGGIGGSGAFCYILILENPDPADYSKIFDILERWTASGIEYFVQVK